MKTGNIVAQLYIHIAGIYNNNIVPSGFQKDSAIRHLTMQILFNSIYSYEFSESYFQKLGIFLQE